MRRLTREESAGEGFDRSGSVGLFIGIRSFRDEALADVPYGVDDAVDLAHLFCVELSMLSPKCTTLALSGEPQKRESKQRLQSLISSGARQTEADRFSVYKELERVRVSGTASGMLLLSVASHGFMDEGVDFLVTSDTLRNRVVRTGIPMNDLLDDISLSKIPRRLVLLDMCRERLERGTRGISVEPLGRENGMSGSMARAISQARGQIILAATVTGGIAFDDRAAENGVFTSAILRGLQGAAEADPRGFITPSTLSRFVGQYVKDWVRDNRPAFLEKCTGITKQTEGLAGSMPLAVRPGARDRYTNPESRRQHLIAILRSHTDYETITGETAQAIFRALRDSEFEDIEELSGRVERLER